MNQSIRVHTATFAAAVIAIGAACTLDSCDLYTSPDIIDSRSESIPEECLSLARLALATPDTLTISIPGTDYCVITLTDDVFSHYGLKPEGSPETAIGASPVTVYLRDVANDSVITSSPIVIHYNRTDEDYVSAPDGSVLIDYPVSVSQDDPCRDYILAKHTRTSETLPSEITLYTAIYDSLLLAMGNKFQGYSIITPWPWNHPALVAFTNYEGRTSEDMAKFRERLDFMNTRTGINLFEETADTNQANVIVSVNDVVSQTKRCPNYYPDKDLVTLRPNNYLELILRDFLHEMGWHITTRIALEGGAGTSVGRGPATDYNDSEVSLTRSIHLPLIHGDPPIIWSTYSAPPNGESDAAQ